MPIYVYACPACAEHEVEGYFTISEPAPECCGAPMEKRPQTAGMAFITKGGNWGPVRACASGPVWKGGGRPKPKTIGKGHGVGGRRKNPTIDRTQLPSKPRSMP